MKKEIQIKGDIIVSQTALICFANHEMELYN